MQENKNKNNDMRQIGISEIKTLSFEVLCAVCEVCEAHGLSYSLTGGTLLGAVRHKGFIPWDDDIDIMLPRPDYDRLIEIVKEGDYGFNLFAEEICGEDYGYPFAKACHKDTVIEERKMHHSNIQLGVYIDIFPVDGMGRYYKLAKIRCMMFRILHGMKISSNWTRFRKSKKRKWYYEPFRYMCYLVSKLLSRNFIDRKINCFVRKKDFNESKYAGRYVGDYGWKEIMPKALFESTVKLEFENKYFHAIEDYHTFLSSLYGDYMTLPPKEKQVTHHEFDAYVIGNKR